MAVAALLVLAVVLGLTTAKPGIFITNSLMNNQRLPYPLEDGVFSPTDDMKTCESHCSLHPECDAYSYSKFHKVCQTYKTEIGTKAIMQNMYKLYVLEKSLADGFHKIGTNYVKLFDNLMTAYEAQDFCETRGGDLVAINSEAVQNLTARIVLSKTVFNTFIGITDVEVEGAWKYYSDGSNLKYENWDWNGQWDRVDLNCAYMKVDGFWHHTNCGNKFYFFCQIPMF